MKKHLHPRHGLLFKIMRLTFYQLVCIGLLSAMAYAHNSPAQDLLNKGITIQLKNVTLQQALTKLEEKAKIRFAYSSDLVDMGQQVTMAAENQKLGLILDQLLTSKGIAYRVSNDQILLSKAQKKTSEINSKETLLTANSVEISISGTVKAAENNEPLPGVSIILKGTQRGTTTDVNGKFQLDVPDASATIILSFVGYVSQEIVVGNRTMLDLSLKADTKALDEVVVVGYGTQKKSTLTGSVASIKGGEIAETPVPNISNSMAGKVAGVSMRPNGGQPGSDSPDIHIRGIGTTGNNKPLIVVDGIIRDNINQIDPTAIETISILKDAAAVAPYGLGGC